MKFMPCGILLTNRNKNLDFSLAYLYSFVFYFKFICVVSLLFRMLFQKCFVLISAGDLVLDN
jgi:hypothetical protein